MAQGRQFDTLTSLKGFFILIIAFHNTMLIQPLFDSLPASAFLTLYGGALGNSMFFILSGFCMAYSYRNRIAEHAIIFKDFLLNRLKKLYPLYLITNLIALILAIVQYGFSVFNLRKVIFTVLLQLGGGLAGAGPYNSPTWFLCTLIFCYTVFYFVTYHAKSSTHYHVALVFGIVCGYGCMTNQLSIPFCHSGNGVGLMNFFIGCSLAEILPLIRYHARKWAAPASFCTLLFFFYLLHSYGIEIICGDVNTAFAFCISPLIVYLALAEGLCAKILLWKPFVYLGKISGSIFFWHLVIYNAYRMVFSRLAPEQVIQEKHYLMYFAVMLAWSALSYHFSQYTQHRQSTTPA